MKQVFVAGPSYVTPIAAGSNQRFSALAAGQVGIWGNREDSLEGDFFATALVASTIEDGSAADATDAVTLAQGLMLKPQFQLVQGMPAGGNPIASPIINASQVQKIEYITHLASVRGKSVVTLDSLTPAVGDEISFRFRVSYDGNAHVYDAQINGAADKLGLGHYHGRVINFSYTCGSTTLDTEGAGLATAINNSVIGNFATASYNASNDDLTVTADAEGTNIEILGKTLLDVQGDFLGGGTDNSALVTNTAFTAGAGNYHQVLSEEKQARYAQGNFNRMYFPDDYTSYVDSAEVYDQVRITYKNNLSPNVFHGGNAGLNELVFYWKETVSGSTAWDTVFGFSQNTSSTLFVNG